MNGPEGPGTLKDSGFASIECLNNRVLEDIHPVEIGDKPPAKVSGNANLKARLPLLGQG